MTNAANHAAPGLIRDMPNKNVKKMTISRKKVATRNISKFKIIKSLNWLSFFGKIRGMCDPRGIATARQIQTVKKIVIDPWIEVLKIGINCAGE